MFSCQLFAIAAFTIGLAVARPAVTQSSDSTDTQRLASSYQFHVARGKGTPVCDAYSKRLTATQYQKSPYCGIPEDDSVSGFRRLNRVSLTPGEVADLSPHIIWFVKAQNQSLGGHEISPEDAKVFLGSALVAWRYQPAVSLNNDGRPTNVLIWQGFGVDNDKYECGEDVTFHDRSSPVYSTQFGFILTPNNDQIDEANTRAIFEHPRGNTVVKVPGQSPIELPGFAEVGYSVNIFEFRGQYYISAFYGLASGDFYGKRKYQQSLKSTLAVFHRQDGKTTLMCELRMAEVPLP